MKGISNAEIKLTTFIEQYMIPQEFILYSFLFLLAFLVGIFAYIVYNVSVNEKSAKLTRKSLKKDDVVRVHGIVRDCTVLEVNGDKILVAVEVPMGHIYTK